MGRLLTFLTLAALAAPAAYGQNGHNNGARVGKTGFLLNVLAFARCPDAQFANSHRHALAVRADFTGVATDDTARANKIFLRPGPAFRVQDGNACDSSGAYFELPVTGANCANCNGPASTAPRFAEYEVRLRVRGKPGGKGTVTSCAEMLEIDPVSQAQTPMSYCAVGDSNVAVGTRITGGALAGRWENVSADLLTVCIDQTRDGVCDDRVGLFDSSGRDYWWNVDSAGRPHLQLVFFPVQPGSTGPSSDPPPDPTPDPTPDPEPDPTPDPGPGGK